MTRTLTQTDAPWRIPSLPLPSPTVPSWLRPLMQRWSAAWAGSPLPLALWTGLLAVAFAALAYISWITPPMGDTWGYIILAETRSAWDLFFDSYLNGYMHRNPRIGQYALLLGAYGPLAQTVVNTLSLVLLLVAGFALATGRLPRADVRSVALLFVALGTIVAAGAQIGLAFFYMPYTANYVFGFALLALFLALVRMQGARVAPGPGWIVAAVPLGLLAGLSNEHTPPVFIALGVLLAALSLTRFRVARFDAFRWTALCALLVGYALLYFAPGQSKRYGGLGKEEGLSALLSDPFARVAKLADALFTNSAPFYAVALLLVGAVAVHAARRGRLAEAFWPALLLAASFGIAAVCLASPLTGQRLLFASYATLGFSLAGGLHYLARESWAPWAIGGAGALGATLTFAFLANALPTYRALDQAYAMQVAAIDAAKKDGATAIRLAPYPFDFRGNRDMVRLESFRPEPEHRLNRLRARVYRLESFSYAGNHP